VPARAAACADLGCEKLDRAAAHSLDRIIGQSTGNQEDLEQRIDAMVERSYKLLR
jgi:hypothetical protein